MCERSYTGREKFNMNLIKEVQKYEIIYDNKHRDFRNKEKKEDTWHTIGRTLCEKSQLCRDRWSDLRKQYAKEYLKMTTPGAIRNSYWRYTDAMSFLKGYEAQKTISSDPVGGANISKSDMYCRACLCKFINDSGERSRSYNVFEISELAEKLTQCSNRQVVQWDEYPQSVCEKCYKKIVYFSQFQLMCHTSLEKFNTILHDPKQVTIDLNETLDDSLNCLIEETNLNSLLEDVNGAETPPPTHKLKEMHHTNKIPHTEYEIEFDDTIMEEIIQVEIERSTECDSRKSDETVEITEMPHIQAEEPIEEVNDADMSGEMRADEEQLECVEYVDEDDGEDEYVVDELSEDDEEVPISDNETDQFSCDVCQKPFRFQSSLEAHQGTHQGLPAYPCPRENCAIVFNGLDELRTHLRNHKEMLTVFKCDIDNCNKVYAYNGSLKLHKRRDHGCEKDRLKYKYKRVPKNYMCEECGKVSSSLTKFKEHRLMHVDKSQWPHVCDVEGCTKRFRILSRLRIHQKRHAGIKNYVCPHCGMRKTTRTELTIHINYHTFERKYPCRFCPKVFKSVGAVGTHIHQVHEGKRQKPKAKHVVALQCSYCDRNFSHAQRLKHHELTHTGERPYACRECGKTFASPTGRHIHMQMHLKGENPYACEECGKTFKWSTSLKAHKKLHVEGAVPYTCEECGKGYRWAGAYYAHKKKHIKEKMEENVSEEADGKVDNLLDP